MDWADEDDLLEVADCAPPVRAVDAQLPDRIARGVAGVWEARQVQGLLLRLQRYEQALRHIAVHGDADSAMLASRTLVGDGSRGGGARVRLPRLACLTGQDASRPSGRALWQDRPMARVGAR
jgi:hypothetical protein